MKTNATLVATAFLLAACGRNHDVSPAADVPALAGDGRSVAKETKLMGTTGMITRPSRLEMPATVLRAAWSPCKPTNESVQPGRRRVVIERLFLAASDTIRAGLATHDVPLNAICHSQGFTTSLREALFTNGFAHNQLPTF